MMLDLVRVLSFLDAIRPLLSTRIAAAHAQTYRRPRRSTLTVHRNLDRSKTYKPMEATEFHIGWDGNVRQRLRWTDRENAKRLMESPKTGQVARLAWFDKREAGRVALKSRRAAKKRATAGAGDEAL